MLSIHEQGERKKEKEEISQIFEDKFCFQFHLIDSEILECAVSGTFLKNWKKLYPLLRCEVVKLGPKRNFRGICIGNTPRKLIFKT